MKKVQDKINANSFMTLTHDFNTLLDHYTMVRTINKKLKYELYQSGEREKQFLQLLKKTDEYGREAEELEDEFEAILRRIEKEYQLYQGDQRFIKVRGKQDQNVRIPRLDFDIIRYQ